MRAAYLLSVFAGVRVIRLLGNWGVYLGFRLDEEPT